MRLHTLHKRRIKARVPSRAPPGRSRPPQDPATDCRGALASPQREKPGEHAGRSEVSSRDEVWGSKHRRWRASVHFVTLELGSSSPAAEQHGANRRPMADGITSSRCHQAAALPRRTAGQRGGTATPPSSDCRRADGITWLRRWLYQREPRPRPYLCAALHVVGCVPCAGRHAAGAARRAAPDAVPYQLFGPQQRRPPVPWWPPRMQQPFP